MGRVRGEAGKEWKRLHSPLCEGQSQCGNSKRSLIGSSLAGIACGGTDIHPVGQ